MGSERNSRPAADSKDHHRGNLLQICRSRPVNDASGILRIVTALARYETAFVSGSVTWISDDSKFCRRDSSVLNENVDQSLVRNPMEWISDAIASLNDSAHSWRKRNELM